MDPARESVSTLTARSLAHKLPLSVLTAVSGVDTTSRLLRRHSGVDSYRIMCACVSTPTTARMRKLHEARLVKDDAAPGVLAKAEMPWVRRRAGLHRPSIRPAFRNKKRVASSCGALPGKAEQPSGATAMKKRTKNTKPQAVGNLVGGARPAAPTPMAPTPSSVWAAGALLTCRPNSAGWWYDRKYDQWRKIYSNGEISDGENATRWSVSNYAEERDRWWGPIRPKQNP